MGEEFLEDQIEDNGKKAANVDISFSPSNKNLNSTLKSLPKENYQKKEINIKNWIFKWFDKENFFWMLTIKDNKEKSREEKELDAGDRFTWDICLSG